MIQCLPSAGFRCIIQQVQESSSVYGIAVLLSLQAWQVEDWCVMKALQGRVRK